MPFDLMQVLNTDPALTSCYEAVKEYALTLLGGIHHICTNDFRTPTGAVVWTAHGAQHSERLEEILKKLVQLPSVKPPLSARESCALFCAAWLHDVGMFLRHPDFPNLDVQRRYHGRLARTMLKFMPNSSLVPSELTNLIPEICELHQTTCQTNRLDSRTILLGNLLLMADALDIGWHRTSHAREGKAVQSMISRTTAISETSAVEWWVNDCVSSSEPTPQPDSKLEVCVAVEAEQLRKWKRDATGQNDFEPADAATLLTHIRDSLDRYLRIEHLGAIRARKAGWADMITDIRIRLMLNGQPVRLAATNKYRYHKTRKVWAEQVSDYDLGARFRSALEAIKTAAAADDIYLFLFDGPSDTIRYLDNDAILDINNIRGDDREDAMRRQRIQRKCGIVGHVAFCGLATAVGVVERDPRRCYRDLDEQLRLRSVMFQPLLRGRNLWAVIMVNKQSGDIYPSQYGEGFMNAVKSEKDALIGALEQQSEEYID